MFAPLRRGVPIPPESRVVALLGSHPAGATAAALADELLRVGSAVGTRAPVVRRVEALLDELEQHARVERIPDGRYRVSQGRA